MDLLIIGAIVIAVLIGILVSFFLFYRKVSTNEVMIITGAFLGKEGKVVQGGGAVVIPGLQEVRILDLSAFTLNFNIESGSKTQVPLIVEGTATLNIGNDAQMIETAARKFLGVSEEDRNQQLSEIVRGQIRGILGGMNPEDVPNKKDEFAKRVLEDLQPLMTSVGVEVVSVQINDVKDREGFIESLYAEDVANKRAEAEQAKARANARSRATRAEQDRLAKEAELEAELQVAEREKNIAISKAEFRAEQEAKEATAAQAGKIASAEASKETITKEGEAREIEAEKAAQVAKRQVEIERQRLEADVIAKTDADAKAREINAKADAAAREYEAEATFNVRKKDSDANKYSIETAADAEAERITKIGNADAARVLAAGQAEAEATKLMAEALETQGEAILRQALIEKLPEIARVLAEPLGNIDNLTVFDGAEGVTKTAVGSFNQVQEMIKSTTGLDIVGNENARAAGTHTITGDAEVEVDVKKTSAEKTKATKATTKK